MIFNKGWVSICGNIKFYYYSEEDIVNFFPVNRAKENRQELTDTFSIEEMSVSGPEDEDDLHLVPPLPVYKKFGCCGAQTDKCIIM